MSKTPRIKVTAEELYRRVLIDTIIRLFNAYKDMVVVREMLHAAFPGDKAEIDRFLAETSRTIEPLHEVSESAPKTSSLRTKAMPQRAPYRQERVLQLKPMVEEYFASTVTPAIQKAFQEKVRVHLLNEFTVGKQKVSLKSDIHWVKSEAPGVPQPRPDRVVIDFFPVVGGKQYKGTRDWIMSPTEEINTSIVDSVVDQMDLSMSKTDKTIPTLRGVLESSLRTQAGVKDIWNAFVSRIKALLGGIASIDSAMDDAIAAVESVAGTEAQASMRHILTNKRADILEVVGSKDALKNSTLLPLFAKLFKIQPIAMGPLSQSPDHMLFAREVQIPRIPESIRHQVMAVINQTAIKPEVEEAMKLLMGMKKANAELAAKVKQVQDAFGSNESLKKAVPKATETVLAYVKKLTSKQRRLEDALFRATTRVKRGNVDYKTVVETLRAAAEQADTVLLAEIDKLLAANTRESENVDDLEIILDQVPQEARDQLREMSAPAPSAPATVPQS